MELPNLLRLRPCLLSIYTTIVVYYDAIYLISQPLTGIISWALTPIIINLAWSQHPSIHHQGCNEKSQDNLTYIVSHFKFTSKSTASQGANCKGSSTSQYVRGLKSSWVTTTLAYIQKSTSSHWLHAHVQSTFQILQHRRMTSPRDLAIVNFTTSLQLKNCWNRYIAEMSLEMGKVNLIDY